MLARRRIALVACVLGCAAVAVGVKRWHGSLYDDAYIYFRYADHVVEGCGLRFNCDGPRVEGYSSPLYLALLCVVRLFTHDLESASQVIGALASCAAIVLAVLATRQMVKGLGSVAQVAPVVTALALASARFVFHAVVGMETALAAASVSALLYCAVTSGRGLRSAALFVALTRPEGLAFVVCLPLVRRERRLHRLAPLAALCLSGFALRWALFGTLLPNTYAAKSGWTLLHAEYGLRYLLDSFAAHPALLLAPLALGSRGTGVRLVLAGAGLSIVSIVLVGGDFYPFGRLVAPLVPALTTIGVGALVRLTASRPAGQAAVLLVACVALALDARRGASPEAHGFERVRHWAEVGAYLRVNRPGATIAVAPCGALPYAFRGRVIDLLGLNDPTIAHAGRSVPRAKMRPEWIGHERHDLAHVLAQKPDIIVLMEWRSQRWSVEDARGGVYAEQEIVSAILRHQAPYRVVDLEVRPAVHQLAFERVAEP